MGTKWELTLFPDKQNLADTQNPPLAGGTDINQQSENYWGTTLPVQG